MGGTQGQIDIRDRNYEPLNENISTPRTDIDTKFEKYISKLELSDKQIQKILFKKEIIDKILSEELMIEDEHIIGSYARDTIINKLEKNDIDIMIVLNSKRYGEWLIQDNGPNNCLQKIKNVLEKDIKLRNSKISIDKNVLSIKYKDFTIDIVPAFRKDSGGYLIPNTGMGRDWIHTNPRMYKKIMMASDKSNHGRVIKLIKIVKGWSEDNGKHLKSFHIETMVYNYFRESPKNENRTISDDVKDFYSRLRWYLRAPTKEPVYDERIDTYLSKKKRETVIRKAQLAYDKIKKAHNYELNGEINNAELEYSKMFSNKY